MGLTISRKTGESITITDKESNEKIVITIKNTFGSNCKLTVSATKRFIIDRTEKMKKEEE